MSAWLTFILLFVLLYFVQQSPLDLWHLQVEFKFSFDYAQNLESLKDKNNEIIKF